MALGNSPSRPRLSFSCGRVPPRLPRRAAAPVPAFPPHRSSTIALSFFFSHVSPGSCRPGINLCRSSRVGRAPSLGTRRSASWHRVGSTRGTRSSSPWMFGGGAAVCRRCPESPSRVETGLYDKPTPDDTHRPSVRSVFPIPPLPSTSTRPPTRHHYQLCVRSKSIGATRT